MSGDVNEWPAELVEVVADELHPCSEPEIHARSALDAAVAFRDEAGNPVLVRADEISNWWEAEEARAEAAETQLRVREQSLETANAGWVAAKRERDEWERTAAQAYTLANFRAERVAELEYALRGLLAWAERYRGGDASLDPEEWYIESEHSKRVLAVQETEGT